MITKECEIVTMKRRLKTVRFAVFNDGTFQEILDGGFSELCLDFAHYFISMCDSGWKYII